MEKDYNQSEGNSENKMEEPTVVYGKNQVLSVPCQYSLKEIDEQIRIGLKEKKEGLGISHEELKKRFEK